MFDKLYSNALYCDDGGETWQDEHEDDELFDGPPDVYGCKAGLLRLPCDDRDVLVFSTPGRRDIREDITVHVSFDGGGTWPVKRLVRKGQAAGIRFDYRRSSVCWRRST